MAVFRAKSFHALATAAGLCALVAAPAGHALEKIEFQVAGGDKDLTDALRASSLLIAAEAEGNTTAQDLFGTARAEYARLVGALYAQGYYSPVIQIRIDGREAAEIAPLNAPASIGTISVQVNPGAPFAFSRTAIAPLAPKTELPKDFAVGERARSGVVRDAVSTAVDAWRDIGHAKTDTAGQDVVADHAQRTLAVDVALAPGPRLRFGPLTITGQQRMREGRIRKIMGLPEGEVYSPAELNRAADRLRRTGVFSSVAVTEDDGVIAPDLLGITANVVEQKRRRYSFGAELSSFDGATVSGSWLHRNLLGGAERLTISGEIGNLGAQTSGEDYTLGVTLDRPATLTPDTTLSFHAELAHLDEEDYVLDGGNIGATFSHILSDRLTARLGLEYSYAEVNDDSGDFIYKNLSLPAGLLWDSRNVALDATEGYYLDAEAMPFMGYGTTDSGLRVKMDGRAYTSFGAEQGVTLAGRVQAGAVFGADLLNTPRDYLFYSGGGGTVRGQPYQSLGVNVLRSTLPDYKIGGLSFLAASAEVRTRITDTIGVVGFVDAGHVGAQDFFDDLGDWHAGAGLGIRYDTGFGPIRLDVAAPVGGDTGEGVQIYVGIGQSF